MTQPLMTTFIREDRVNPTDPNAPPSVAPPPRGRRARRPRWRAAAVRPKRSASPRVLHDAGVGAVLKPSRGEHGTIFVQTRDAGANAVPTVVVSGEHYNNIIRLLEDRVPVQLRVNVQGRYFTQDTSGYNVIAELPGTDPRLRDEVVMIGAHLDSWHAATGATDNADGAATVLEAMRILKAVGARPRRTIRVALWGGEEEGLFGSRAWVARHLSGDANRAARDKMSVYLNIDPGYGPVYGFFMEGNATGEGDLRCLARTVQGSGRPKERDCRDRQHRSSQLHRRRRAGHSIPFRNTPDYDVRIHHTNMDTMERMKPDDVKQAAIIFAAFAYNAAMRDAPIPR